MNVEVKVVTNAAKQRIVREHGRLKVYVNSSPDKGKANKELRKILSDYYNLPKSCIRIIRGVRNRNKIIEIMKGVK